MVNEAPMKFLTEMLTGDMSFRDKALTEEINGIIIDTVCPIDTDKWETGIKPKGGDWVVVEQYKNQKEAKKGHLKWINKIKKNPKQKLIDCNVWEL